MSEFPKLTYEVTIDGTLRNICVQKLRPGRFVISIDNGPAREVDLVRPSPEALQLLISGASWEVGCVPGPTENGGISKWMVDVVGVPTHVQVEDPRRKALKSGSASGNGLVATSMPGRIIRVVAGVGEAVKKGQPVVVIEAMKMENELKAPIDGVIAEVMVSPGQAVESGTKLLRIEGT